MYHSTQRTHTLREKHPPTATGFQTKRASNAVVFTEIVSKTRTSWQVLHLLASFTSKSQNITSSYISSTNMNAVSIPRRSRIQKQDTRDRLVASFILSTCTPRLNVPTSMLKTEKKVTKIRGTNENKLNHKFHIMWKVMRKRYILDFWPGKVKKAQNIKICKFSPVKWCMSTKKCAVQLIFLFSKMV